MNPGNTITDPLWDADFLGCKLTGLPYVMCGCEHHARTPAELPGLVREPGGAEEREERGSLGTCAGCGGPLIPGETYRGVFCSWLCSFL